jgi:hypothetical protein
MKKLVLLLVIATTTLEVSASVEQFNKGNDPGFNYKKHYRKAKRTRFLNRVFNLNNCRQYRRNGYL